MAVLSLALAVQKCNIQDGENEPGAYYEPRNRTANFRSTSRIPELRRSRENPPHPPNSTLNHPGEREYPPAIHPLRREKSYWLNGNVRAEIHKILKAIECNERGAHVYGEFNTDR
jgi:hypothetical protein